MRHPAGFTLVELLVVLAILSLAMGMVMTGHRAVDREAAVKASADQFAAVCVQVRSRAIAERAQFAIAINIQNEPGSSGRVLNNRSGGHWYRAVAAYRYSPTGARRLLIAGPACPEVRSPNDFLAKGYYLTTFTELVEELKTTWVGPQYDLPAGKARFLALSDTDEGARVNAGLQTGSDLAAAYGYVGTYPRPYFGWFDPVRHRLFPWGGYDPALHASDPWPDLGGGDPAVNYTGFFYQGSGAAVPDSRNPADRSYNVDWNHDGVFAGSDPQRGPEQAKQLLVAGDPRPLVSGEWQDYLIVFQPDGTIYVPPFKTNRKRYSSKQFVPGSSDESLNFANGVLDTTRAWARIDGFTGGWNASSWGFTREYDARYGLIETSEMAHFDRHTGSYRITFAPDSPDDRDTFGSAREAMESIAPMWRVELSRQGAIRAYRVKSDAGDGVLAGATPWPPTPGWFADPANAAEMGLHFRYGWQHEKSTLSGIDLDAADPYDPAHKPWGRFHGGPDDLIPRWRPILDTVSPRMLTDRIWWLQ